LYPHEIDLPARGVPGTSRYSDGRNEETAVLLLHPPPTQPPGWDVPGAAPLRVLVVEDNADTASTCQMLLQLHGLEVRTAPDAANALETVRNFKPDVVLLDIALPGPSGWEVARRLKEEHAGKPPFLIAVTGYGRETDQQRSEKAGIDLHLVKPVDPMQLLGLLERFEKVVR
jgi:CheY-like chemotaxis protein